MKVNSLITQLGDLLQEDFTNAPLWTRAELHGYLRQIIRDFSVRTAIIDKSLIRIVDNTTGEADMPSDFDNAFYILFDQHYLDLVQLSELDFVDGDWMLGGTGASPAAATVFGSGNQSRIRFVPVPATVSGSFGSGVVSVPTLADSGSVVWTVSATALGALVTTTLGTSGLTLVIAGPTTYWDLGINTLGKLTLTTSASVSADVVYVIDTSSITWRLTATDMGQLITTDISVGLLASARLGTTYQTFSAGANSTNANYGVVVDTYATGVSTTPSDVLRLDSPFGTTLFNRTSNNAADVWYKGHLKDVLTLESEIYLSDSMLPVIKHGVLSLAFGHEGDGQDFKKAKILSAIFMTECDAIKNLFGQR